MGRPPSFDRDQVLEQAMKLFWSQGYSETSVGDLAEQTGLQAGSLYNAFENKRTLFEQATKHYVDTVINQRIEILRRDGPIVDRIEAFLEDVAEQSLNPERIPGCLLTNTAVKNSGLPSDVQAILQNEIVELETVFEEAIRDALAGQPGSNSDPRQLARFLVAVVQGMNVLGRSAPDQQRLHDLIESAMQTVHLHLKGDSVELASQ